MDIIIPNDGAKNKRRLYLISAAFFFFKCVGVGEAISAAESPYPATTTTVIYEYNQNIHNNPSIYLPIPEFEA